MARIIGVKWTTASEAGKGYTRSRHPLPLSSPKSAFLLKQGSTPSALALCEASKFLNLHTQPQSSLHFSQAGCPTLESQNSLSHSPELPVLSLSTAWHPPSCPRTDPWVILISSLPPPPHIQSTTKPCCSQHLPISKLCHCWFGLPSGSCEQPLPCLPPPSHQSPTPLTLDVGAKSLRSCPTLCDPMNCRPPGSLVHGIFQARILEWAAIRPPGDLPDPGTEPPAPLISPGLSQLGSFPLASPGKYVTLVTHSSLLWP